MKYVQLLNDTHFNSPNNNNEHKLFRPLKGFQCRALRLIKIAMHHKINV